mgnify:CR=1 FL=1
MKGNSVIILAFLIILGYLAFFGTIAYIAWHFITKWW